MTQLARICFGSAQLALYFFMIATQSTLALSTPVVYDLGGQWTHADKSGTWSATVRETSEWGISGHLRLIDQPTDIRANIAGFMTAGVMMIELFDPRTASSIGQLQGAYDTEELSATLSVGGVGGIELQGNRRIREMGPFVAEEIRDSLSSGQACDALVAFDYRDAFARVRKLRAAGMSLTEAAVERERLLHAHKSGLEELNAIGVSVVRNLAGQPTVLVTIENREALDAVLALPGVIAVNYPGNAEPTLDETLPLIGVTDVNGTRVVPVTGAGFEVVVVDAAVDYRDSLFGPCSGPDDPVNVCPLKELVHFISGDSGLDLSVHGTSVAKIVTSVAPGARIVSLDTTSPDTCTVTGALCQDPFDCFPNQCQEDGQNTLEIIDTVQWVLDRASTRNFAAINFSLKTNLFTAPCNQSSFAPLFRLALDEGIVPVAASANDGLLDRIGEPACVRSALSVGNVNDGALLNYPADSIASTSNAASFLRVLAPGNTATFPNSGNFNGTSSATAHASGAVALLREAFPEDTAACIIRRLEESGTPVLDDRDPSNPRTFPRIDVSAALQTRATFHGDCDGDKKVRVHELIKGVKIALNQTPLTDCPSIDDDGDGSVAVGELVSAVNNASTRCPLGSV